VGQRPVIHLTEQIQPTERAFYDRADRQRGLRLSALVGTTSGGVLAIAILFLGALCLTMPASESQFFPPLLSILTICLALDGIGIWLARKQFALLAATTISSTILIAIFASQVTHERVAGLDAIVLASCASYCVLIALAGVLATRFFMFNYTVLTSAVTVAICLIIPGSPSLSAIITCAILLLSQWLASGLTYISQRVYVATVSELGDLRRAYERARQLDELKDQFIRNINHELRNPVMALYTSIDMLRLGGDNIGPKQRTSILERAVRTGDRIIQLLTTILDTSRYEQQAAEFVAQPVRIIDCVQAALDMANPVSSAHSVRISIPPDLIVMGDEVRLQQVLTNLLSNAIKYSPAMSPIDLYARIVTEPLPVTDKRRNEPATTRIMAEISVRDYGLGIPPEQANLLFQRFVRLPRDMMSSISGNGLGLYICRIMIETMGGTIGVESTGVEGEGATFFFRLPLPSNII
jgi:signal transduction histidine kinase